MIIIKQIIKTNSLTVEEDPFQLENNVTSIRMDWTGTPYENWVKYVSIQTSEDGFGVTSDPIGTDAVVDYVLKDSILISDHIKFQPFVINGEQIKKFTVRSVRIKESLKVNPYIPSMTEDAFVILQGKVYILEQEMDQAQSDLVDLANNKVDKVEGKELISTDILTDLTDGNDTTLHIHDSRYYTETEVDTLLSNKSDVGHIHDDRYYTESEIDTIIGNLDAEDISFTDGAIYTATDVSNALKEVGNFSLNLMSTGVYEFNGITKVDNTHFSVGSAKGYIVDNTSVNNNLIYIEFAGLENIEATNIGISEQTQIFIDNTGSLRFYGVDEVPDSYRRNMIYLGRIVHPFDIIVSVESIPDYIQSPTSQIRDLWKALGIINDNNYVYPANASADLTLSLHGGSLYYSGINFVNDSKIPSKKLIESKTALSFNYRLRDGSGTNNVTVIDPNYYDLDGVLTPVSAAGSTNQRIYMSPNGVVFIQYGQVVYADIKDALLGVQTEAFTPTTPLKANAVLIGILTVQRDITNFSDTETFKFHSTSKLGELSGGGGGSGAVNAEDVAISDLGEYYISTNVEGSLQEIGQTMGTKADKVDLILLSDEIPSTPLPRVADLVGSLSENAIIDALATKVDKETGKSLVSDTLITDLTDGSDTNLHTHDDRYYTETETNTLLGNKADKLFATNLITNGDFSNGTTGWTTTGGTLTAENNVGIFTAGFAYASFHQTISTVIGNKYYSKFSIVSGVTNPTVYGGFLAAPYYTQGSNEQLVSTVQTASATSHKFTIIDARSGSWAPIKIKYAIVIDLTALFGAGNEPSKEQIDRLLSIYPNSWFDGTKEITNIKQVFNEKADKLYATNLITNGDLSSGVVSPWYHGSTYSTEVIENGVLKSTKNTYKPYVGQPIGTISNGTKLYTRFTAKGSKDGNIQAKIESTYGASLRAYYNVSLTTSYQTFSSILTTSGGDGTYISFDGLDFTSTDDSIYLDNVLLINLTDTFGAGKEPTKTEMDNLLSTFTNSWFNGTTELVNIANLAQLKADKTQEAWITPTLLNSWVNNGSATASFQYMKDSLGFVHIKGTIKGGSSGTVVFTLPVGYRPAAQINAIGLDVNATTKIISIANNGTVTLWGAYTSSVSLDGIIFKAEV